MLTQKQSDLLNYLRAYIGTHDGVSPSFDEIGEALGLKSRSGVHFLLKGLEERGHIRRLPNRARAIEVVERSDAVTRAFRAGYDQGRRDALTERGRPFAGYTA